MNLIPLPLKQQESSYLMEGKSYICVEPFCKDFNPKRLKGSRIILDKSYVPQLFPKHLIDPLEWTHVLATLSTCALPKPIQFYDPDGYDTVPIKMLQPITI